MKKNKIPNIVVLGAEGMLGRTVYNYFLSKYPNSTYGTSRNKNNTTLIYLSVKTAKADFQKIVKKLKKIDYVINTVGVLRSEEDVIKHIEANALFPHILENLAEKYSFNIIHVSTDAVFSDTSGFVDEDSLIGPNSIYGASKFLGETSSEKTITVRTSILGFDPKNKKGILEYIQDEKNNNIKGFTDQNWSGCTTLQFAEFCNLIISNNLFWKVRKISPIFHFAPLKAKSKHELIQTAISTYKLKRVLHSTKSGKKINRLLNSKYQKFPHKNKFENSISDALKKLQRFEQTYSK